MKSFTISLLGLLSGAVAKQKVPRRLNTNSGMFVEDEVELLSRREDVNLGLGVRFVDEDDIKFNDELSKYIDINFIGSKGYLVAENSEPAKFAAGYRKKIPEIEEMKAFLAQFTSTQSMDDLVPDVDDLSVSKIRTPYEDDLAEDVSSV